MTIVVLDEQKSEQTRSGRLQGGDREQKFTSHTKKIPLHIMVQKDERTITGVSGQLCHPHRYHQRCSCETHCRRNQFERANEASSSQSVRSDQRATKGKITLSKKSTLWLLQLSGMYLFLVTVMNIQNSLHQASHLNQQLQQNRELQFNSIDSAEKTYASLIPGDGSNQAMHILHNSFGKDHLTSINETDIAPAIVHKNDYIFKRNLKRFDAAPIVIPQYKLLFFSVPKVACTTFKFLFRRMKGHKDWKSQDWKKILPHNPKYNGLDYLWDYPIEQANEMLTSPEWTRAVFVRDPKERFLSAFLDKAISNDGWHVVKSCCTKALECKENNSTMKTVNEMLQTCKKDVWDSRQVRLLPTWHVEKPCCQETMECHTKAQTIDGFLDIINTCHDEHWTPQHSRMEEKYWKYVNFVGHMETMKKDTELLLKKVGAWDEWGDTGWGPHGNASILDESEYSQSHTTGSNWKFWQWFNPRLERKVELFYNKDYENPLFNFTKRTITRDLPQGSLIDTKDRIYSKTDWDSSPIVVEKYKLIFFTIPKVTSTKWKVAFRRMERYSNWKEIGGKRGLPHDPSGNGLKYLYDYSIDRAEEMLTSDKWTKAIFIRNPKDKFLAVYNQLSRNPEHVERRCCPSNGGCSVGLKTMSLFVDLMKTCYHPHWIPFSERMESKYWPYINFVGRVENILEDSEELLKKIGAWEDIGKSGWGFNNQKRIFFQNERTFASIREQLAFYTPDIDKAVENYYKIDYENEFLNIRTKKVWLLEGQGH